MNILPNSFTLETKNLYEVSKEINFSFEDLASKVFTNGLDLAAKYLEKSMII